MKFDFETFINDFDFVRFEFFVVENFDDDKFDSLIDNLFDHLSSFEKLFRERNAIRFNQKINDEINVEIIDEIIYEINDINDDEFDFDFDDEFDQNLKRINNFFDINELKKIKFRERSKNVKQKNFVMTRKKKTTTKFIKRNSSNFEHIKTIIVNQRNENDKNQNQNQNRKRDQQQNERNELL